MKKVFVMFLAFVSAAMLLAGCAKESSSRFVKVENAEISISDITSSGAVVTIRDTNESPL